MDQPKSVFFTFFYQLWQHWTLLYLNEKYLHAIGANHVTWRSPIRYSYLLSNNAV